MSTDLLIQIDRLEKACHAALRKGDDADTVALLVQTLNTVNFSVSNEERALVRGLRNLASTHADILLQALSTKAPPAVVHGGLVRLCNTLTEFRDAIEAEPERKVS
jgi:hypothetical protein